VVFNPAKKEHNRHERKLLKGICK